jgi:hypothetical protein
MKFRSRSVILIGNDDIEIFNFFILGGRLKLPQPLRGCKFVYLPCSGRKNAPKEIFSRLK